MPEKPPQIPESRPLAAGEAATARESPAAIWPIPCALLALLCPVPTALQRRGSGTGSGTGRAHRPRSRCGIPAGPGRRRAAHPRPHATCHRGGPLLEGASLHAHPRHRPATAITAAPPPPPPPQRPPALRAPRRLLTGEPSPPASALAPSAARR